MAAEFAAYLLWMAFLITWYGAMLWTSRAVTAISTGERWLWFLWYVIAWVLLFATVSPNGNPARIRYAPFLLHPLWPNGAIIGWALIAIEFGFFAFAWWARVHLGKLWSGMITLREGHRVVDTGPYRLVRHPIYTGFLGAAWAFALVKATPVALAGAVLLTVIMTVKAKAEERFLRRELDAAAYDAYATRTPMIVPFLRLG